MSRGTLIQASVMAVIVAGIAGFSAWYFHAEDRRDGNGVCAVHRVPMETVVVPDCSVLADPTWEYGQARHSSFPNAGIDYGPEFYGRRRLKIYVCPECVKARAQWFSIHGQGQ